MATTFHFSYQRFLINKLREKFGFVGSPIRIQVRRRDRNTNVGGDRRVLAQRKQRKDRRERKENDRIDRRSAKNRTAGRDDEPRRKVKK